MRGEPVRTAILGGTFDPVHVGHLFVAEEVLHQLHYDRILFVPARLPPHKNRAPRVSAEQRLGMLSLAIEDNPTFAVDAYEMERDAVSFTIHTVRHLLESGEVKGRPGLIIGEDLIAGFEHWREADEIERLTDIILMRRPGYGAGAAGAVEDAAVRGRPADGFARRHFAVENLGLEVSSSGIRERIRQGKAFRYLVPESVYRYIESNRLYR